MPQCNDFSESQLKTKATSLQSSGIFYFITPGSKIKEKMKLVDNFEFHQSSSCVQRFLHLSNFKMLGTMMYFMTFSEDRRRSFKVDTTSYWRWNDVVCLRGHQVGDRANPKTIRNTNLFFLNNAEKRSLQIVILICYLFSTFPPF